MSTATCTRCPRPLDKAATLNGLTTCTTCELDALRLAIAGRDEGQARASAARPDDRAKVDAAIRRLAATGRVFSANDARELHGVTGPVVGAAFTAARKAGVIRSVGFITSTEARTHAHPVRTWVAA